MAALSSGVCMGVKSYTVSCRSAWWPHKRESLESVCCRCCCWWCFCGCCCVCCYRGAWYQNACTEPRVFIHMCTHTHTHIHTRTHTHTQCGSRQQDEWRKVLMSPWTAGSWRTLLVGWWFNLGYSGSGLRVDVSVCRYRRYWCVFGNKSVLIQTSTMRGGERLRILGNLGWCVCENTHKHTHTHTHTIGVRFDWIKRITLRIPIPQDEDRTVFFLRISYQVYQVEHRWKFIGSFTHL